MNYHERISIGLCGRCGKNQLVSKTRCQSCLDKHVINNNKYKLNHADEIKEKDKARYLSWEPEAKKIYAKKYYEANKEMVLSRTREKRKNEPEKAKEWDLKKSYGMTIDNYNEMLKEQDGRCAICKVHQSELTKSLFVDHDHKTGKIRQLLCVKCNTMLGFAADNPEILSAAIHYLNKHS